MVLPDLNALRLEILYALDGPMVGPRLNPRVGGMNALVDFRGGEDPIERGGDQPQSKGDMKYNSGSDPIRDGSNPSPFPERRLGSHITGSGRGNDPILGKIPPLKAVTNNNGGLPL